MGSFRRVILAGLDGVHVQPGTYGTPRVVSLQELPGSLGPSARGTVVVLGAEALRVFKPGQLQPWLRRPFVVALAVVKHTPQAPKGEWGKSRLAAAVHPEELADRLEVEVLRPVRPIVVPSSWLPRRAPKGSLAAQAMLVLATSESPSMKAVAAVLQVPERRLLRACRRAYGVSLRELRWRYIRAVTDRARELGWTVDSISRSFDLDGKSLRRLYRSAGEAIPARRIAKSGCPKVPLPTTRTGS